MTEETPKSSRLGKKKDLRRKNTYEILIVVAFFAGLLAGYLLRGVGSAGTAVAADELNPPKRYEIETVGYPSQGPADAPITIVEFSDFQCPYCTKWYNETYQQLMADYPGQIRFVYRNFPLTSIHPNAFSAAQASLCANDQGVYWEYHDKLFEANYGLGQDAYLQYAQELSLDMNTFTECLTTEKYADTVQSDLNAAISIGVQSTPTFFVNGLAVVGAQPLGAFKQVIDRELAGN